MSENVEPKAVYDGGYGQSKILLRIGNGGAGQSGLIKVLADGFIQYSVDQGSKPFSVAWYESDTTVTIEYLKMGIVDVGITYNEAAEKIAIDQGIATSPSYYAFHDHFMIVGPPSNPAGLDPNTDVFTMFAQLQASANAGKPVRFLSRYDKSATNIKESQLWLAVGQAPWATSYSTWYHQYIAFPIEALTAAILLQEYTLTDRGTYLSLPNYLTSQTTVYKTGWDGTEIPLRGPVPATIPFSVALEYYPLLSPAHLLIGSVATNAGKAQEFANWLVGVGGQEVVRNYRENGQQVYSVDLLAGFGGT